MVGRASHLKIPTQLLEAYIQRYLRNKSRRVRFNRLIINAVCNYAIQNL